jgi:NADH:ubiquinone oxidoreductase subunit 6 (subunit J)
MINEFIIILAYIFLIISLIFIIFSKNIIIAIFFLIISFIITSIILLFLNCEFLAFIFIIIYVGAISILFLFTIMLLDIKFFDLSYNLIFNFFLGYFFIFLFFFFLINIKLNSFLFDNNFYYIKSINFINWKILLNFCFKIKVYSIILYNYFVIEFLLAGIVLFLVLIGVLNITGNYLNLNTKIRNTIKQVSIKSKFFN